MGFRWTGEGNWWSGLGLEIDWEGFGGGEEKEKGGWKRILELHIPNWSPLFLN